MKQLKYILFVLSVAVATSLVAKPVFAHVLITDGDMGALLHVDPDDDPAAGQVASFIYEFKYEKGSFDLGQCNCQLTISENGKTLTTMGLTPAAGTPSVGLANYTFDHTGVYALDMRGTATNGTAFPTFNLHYSLRVAHTAPGVTNSPRMIVLYALGGVVIVIAAGGIAVNMKSKKKRSKK